MVRFARVLAVLPYALGFLLPPLLIWSSEAGGLTAWLPVVVLFAGVALLDALVPPHPTLWSSVDASRLDGLIEFRVMTWLWVPVHVALMLWAITTGASLHGSAWWALVLGTGAIGGAVGITYAHELMHRTSPWERALGDVLLALVSYPQFALAHVYSHHRHVATPRDAATARLGEGLYAFLVRSVAGSARDAWSFERERLRRRGHQAWHVSNACWRYAATLVLVYGGVWMLQGWWGVGFLVLQSVLAVALLETINYVEHYGLLRREASPGRYEPVAVRHSWDSSHRVSNWLLINLARHADHHLVASRRFPALSSQPMAPQLPFGYGTMLLLATIPPLWRRVMDPRVQRIRRDIWSEV